MMSEFTPGGFAPFPDCYHDNLRVKDFSDLSDAGLDTMVNEYGKFNQRKDLMIRARTAAGRILDHLLFELAYRDGIYDQKDAECLPHDIAPGLGELALQPPIEKEE